MAFSTGDRVQWNTPQGPTQGTVRSTHTDEFEFKGQTLSLIHISEPTLPAA